MNESIKKRLIAAMTAKQTREDPSHDPQHILRVLHMAEKIARSEKADLDIVVPAALFHDIIVYRKDSPQSKYETDESAEYAGGLLQGLEGYPHEKIGAVMTCIRQCSFSKGIVPDLLEAKILQDADRLEATGAISIMRTFSSCGQMNRPFYEPLDPFYVETDYKGSKTGLSLFYGRLLVVEKTMHTSAAKKIARRRTEFLGRFLSELKQELGESGVL